MEVETDEQLRRVWYHPQVQRFTRLLERVTYNQPHRDIVWQYVEVPYFANLRDEVHFRPKVRGLVDVETGAKFDLYMRTVRVSEWERDDFLLEMIYHALLDLEVHEMQEHFFLDGIKIHDPYKNDLLPAPLTNR